MLNPVHSSIKIKGFKTPYNMERQYISNEQFDFLCKQSISIFTDCSNSGLTFQDSLTAILLTGLKWGLELKKPLDD